MNCTSVLFLCTARTFWSGDNLIVQMGPWSANRNVELCSLRNPREIMPVAPPDRTENTCNTTSYDYILSSTILLYHDTTSPHDRNIKAKEHSKLALPTWQFLSSKKTFVTRPTGSKVTAECRGTIRDDAPDDILSESESCGFTKYDYSFATSVMSLSLTDRSHAAPAGRQQVPQNLRQS